MNKHRSGRSTGRRSRPAPVAGLPVNKNDEVTLDIIGMTHDGEGVGRVEGFTLFVLGALPGEKVRAKVLKVKKQYGYAKLLEVIEASSDRVTPPCEIYDRCGGCQLQHLSYTAQLAWKRQLVVDNLQRIGKLQVAGAPAMRRAGESKQAEAGGQAALGGSGAATGRVEMNDAGEPADVQVAGVDSVNGGVADPAVVDNSADTQQVQPAAAIADTTGILVRPTLGMDEPWRYRNKAQVPIGVANGELIGGFYSRGTHRIIDMDTCLIQHESNDDVVRKVKAIARRLGIMPYDEETGQGLLRHVVAKVAFRTGEMMVVLVTNGDRIPQQEEWISEIRREMPAVTSICQNINTKQTNVIFGDITRTLWGNEVIYDYIGDVKFAISARSFYQVNPPQTEVLYGKTVEYAGLTGKETVIDAYCGIGTISLFLAQHAKQVYGVEIVPEAIEDARANAQLNGMNNVTFEVGASEDVIPAWKEQGITPDVIVVDPPRKGCDARLLDTILEMKPERVVYVSCNPSTLARDLRVLEDGGYRTVEVQPVDMFPHTVHVECVVSIYRKDMLERDA
ncbi:23S rRNA (uracil(1939)-C(5))-methyltransferase RlmD [Paenibacillus donghaensis]|uniref:23S rRNA (Uracil(1939)-C(5))-methyltransferase RlmD n=1 Tax=Paenibacillus donghaensis TaxID=414771 RepID=A0A2Z2KRW7_9BACL|nr:23S rRNA (uracil(1939)-C(5))-methyltransferase RlmD [Paenibacillus donghaensis]ASA25619.1 23S rRNA (uracil(1939)-C(5))-methyltransferase RlmD [Paenibacillus donghaensis]